MAKRSKKERLQDDQYILGELIKLQDKVNKLRLDDRNNGLTRIGLDKVSDEIVEQMRFLLAVMEAANSPEW